MMEDGETYGGRIRNICVDDKINKATAAMWTRGAGRTGKKTHRERPIFFVVLYSDARVTFYVCNE
jgi:hypothetical protein